MNSILKEQGCSSYLLVRLRFLIHSQKIYSRGLTVPFSVLSRDRSISGRDDMIGNSVFLGIGISWG